VVSGSLVRAADHGRSGTVTVEDTAGVKTEVTQLEFAGRPEVGRFSLYGSNALDVLTKPFEIGIPVDSIKSIRAKGIGAFEVVYVWMGRDVTMTGPLGNGEFTGKTDFGAVTIPVNKLKQLLFSTAARQLSDDHSKWLNETLNRSKATIVLLDGVAVPVSGLVRSDSFWSRGTIRYGHYPDFRFKRGETLATVDFSKLKTIEVAGTRVTVTLTNGNTATGVISDEARAGFDGIAGIKENGHFFISRNFIKRIVFE
jgi:hypothetical protein